MVNVWITGNKFTKFTKLCKYIAYKDSSVTQLTLFLIIYGHVNP